MKIYLAGCGKIGTKLGQLLSEQHNIVGLKRTPANLSFPKQTIDLSSVITLPTDADVIVFTVTPSQYNEEGYKTVYDTILGNVIDWANQHESPPLLLLVSSTGVYGQQDGELVDENSQTKPDKSTAKWILHGEKQLRTRLTNTITVRFSGIYGCGRNRLLRKALSLSASGEAIQKTPPIWTNRIHEDDCIGVLAFLIEQYISGKTLDDIYLATDDTPVSQYDVLAYLCEQLDQPTPLIKTENLTDSLNKRCDNSKLKALGYKLKYPSYKDGYAKEVCKRIPRCS